MLTEEQTQKIKEQIEEVAFKKLYNLALKNYLGINPQGKNYELAFNQFLTVFEGTHSQLSAFWVAKCYQLGHGTQKDYVKANQFLKTVIAGENEMLKSIAAYQLSINYRLARGLVTQEEKKQNQMFADMYLKKSAKAGYNQAQYEAGARYLFGIGTKQDSVLAIRYLTHAANKKNAKIEDGVYLIDGHAKAQELLGWCYKHGVGVNHVNTTKAIAYTLSASLQQNPSALYQLDESVYDSDFEKEIAKYELALISNREANENKPSFY